jgi:hypothetical protein
MEVKNRFQSLPSNATCTYRYVKVDFENYKRKSEDQMSKAKSFLGTLKKALADAEVGLAVQVEFSLTHSA